MRPYPAVHHRDFASAVIDPATQLTVYRDARGGIIEMGKHGTSMGTETQMESTNLDSRNDTDHDQDSEQDPGS